MKKSCFIPFLVLRRAQYWQHKPTAMPRFNAATGAGMGILLKGTLPSHDDVNGNMPPSRKAERKPPSPYEAAKENLTTEIRYRNDSVCTIAVNDGKVQTNRLWDSAKGILSYLPH